MSLNSWDQKQTITTLESIATPLHNNVPFPTVTVCPHEENESDNWAYLEKFLDSLNFDGKDITSEKIRHDVTG